MLCKNLWVHLVAGRPVVDIRQKCLDLRNAVFKVLIQRNNKCVQLVLLKILVRQRRKKCAYICTFCKLFGKRTQLRCAHAYKPVAVHRRRRCYLHLTVFFVCICRQFLDYLFCYHCFPSFFLSVCTLFPRAKHIFSTYRACLEDMSLCFIQNCLFERASAHAKFAVKHIQRKLISVSFVLWRLRT